MKYNTEIIIELPLKAFIKKFNNVDNLKHWQRGLISAEHISGIPGEFGAKMKLKYLQGKREVELMETITHSRLPYEYHANYDTKEMNNVQQNFFSETPEGHTKWISKNEFIPLTLMMRIVTYVMPRAFKKQSLLYMKDFKNFAENGTSLQNA